MNLEILAEVVHGFVQWVDKKTEKLPYPVYFVSRDGNIFKKLSIRPSKFLWTSRNALWKSSVFSEEDLYYLLIRYTGITTKSKIYRLFGITEKEDKNELLQKNNLNQFIKDNSVEIISSSRQNAVYLHKYFTNNQLYDEKIIIVDVGYGATTQYLLQKHGIDSIGLYMATNNYSFHYFDISMLERLGYLINNRNDTFLFKLIQENAVWLESILNGNLTDTVVGYNVEGKPIFEPNIYNRKQLRIMLAHHEYIVNYKPKGINNLPYQLYQFFEHLDKFKVNEWSRGKENIRKKGTKPFHPQTVIFLCEENFTYGRLAEVIFNFYISKTDLPVIGISNIKKYDNSHNVKLEIEDYSNLLSDMGVHDSAMNRSPELATNIDLEKARCVVCLSTHNHQFPDLDKWRNKRKIWSIPDVDTSSEIRSFEKVRVLVNDLVFQLKTENMPNRVGMLS